VPIAWCDNVQRSGFGIDALYGRAVVRPVLAAASWVADSFDRRVIDGAVEGDDVAFFPRLNGNDHPFEINCIAGAHRLSELGREVDADLRARFVMLANGILTTPKLARIHGMETFQGDSFHTSRWDYNISLEGKTVGIIGTGATAVQAIPELAKVVGQLYVFQRTPSTIDVRDQKATTAEQMEQWSQEPGWARARSGPGCRLGGWAGAGQGTGRPTTHDPDGRRGRFSVPSP